MTSLAEVISSSFGMRSSRARIVIAIAMTPSLNASSRAVSDRPATDPVEGSRMMRQELSGLFVVVHDSHQVLDAPIVGIASFGKEAT